MYISSSTSSSFTTTHCALQVLSILQLINIYDLWILRRSPDGTIMLICIYIYICMYFVMYIDDIASISSGDKSIIYYMCLIFSVNPHNDIECIYFINCRYFFFFFFFSFYFSSCNEIIFCFACWFRIKYYFTSPFPIVDPFIKTLLCLD